MPIRDSERSKYPGGSPTSKEWKALRESILTRAANCCETCGAPNRVVCYRRGDEWQTFDDAEKDGRAYQWPNEETRLVKIVLTIAHLDHDPANNDPANLKALCQLHHNRLDAKERAKGRTARRTAKP